jgi:hypothetical protein
MNTERVDETIPIGWITVVLREITVCATYPRRLIVGSSYLGDIPEDKVNLESFQRARRVDTFLAACLVLDLLAIVLIAQFRQVGLWLAVPFLIWRIIDVTFAALGAILFGELVPRTHRRVKLAPSRIVAVGFLNFLEIAICFGGIYSAWPGLIKCDERDFFMPFHLSFITQLTVGYGDASPLGGMRIVTWVQGICGIVQLVLLVARYLGDLQRSKYDAEQAAAADRPRDAGPLESKSPSA